MALKEANITKQEALEHGPAILDILRFHQVLCVFFFKKKEALEHGILRFQTGVWVWVYYVIILFL